MLVAVTKLDQLDEADIRWEGTHETILFECCPIMSCLYLCCQGRHFVVRSQSNELCCSLPICIRQGELLNIENVHYIVNDTACHISKSGHRLLRGCRSLFDGGISASLSQELPLFPMHTMILLYRPHLHQARRSHRFKREIDEKLPSDPVFAIFDMPRSS